MKRCTSSRIIRERQIETTGCHLLPLSIDMTENQQTENKCRWGCREPGTLLHCRPARQMVQDAGKQDGGSPKNQIQFPSDPATLLLGMDAEGLKAGIQAGVCTPMFKAMLFATARRWKHPGIHRQMDGQTKCGVYTRWSTAQARKGRKFWQLLQYRWTLRPSCWVKLVRCQRTDAVWFYLHQGARVAEFTETKSRMAAARSSGREAREVSVSRTQGFSLGWRKSSGDGRWCWLHNNVDVFNGTKLYAEKWPKR